MQKTIAEAKDLISGGNPIETRKLKLLRTSFQTKCSELQGLDRDIVELLEDVSKIYSESCELNRGYYMAARGYEFYLRVLQVSLTSERSERVRDTFSTRR